MSSYLQRIATGPQLSKSLSFDAACHGMQLILDGQVDPVQAGIFLIALRMKRETDEENLGILQALLDATDRVRADVDELVDIADPYNGYTRGLPASAFVPAVLAACGLPAVSHGVATQGPKYGVTAHKVLRAASINPDLSPQQAAAQLSEPEIGWAYVDQRRFCPKLHDLLTLRKLIVKRPCLTTAEVLLKPIMAPTTHLMTGFVHKAYPRVYNMLARKAGFDSALIIRGVEGGVVPSLSQSSRLFRYQSGQAENADRDDEGERVRLDPALLGIAQTDRAVPHPEGLSVARQTGDGIAATVDIGAASRAAAAAGLAALQGQHGLMYDSLVYAAAIVLWHCGRQSDLAAGARVARQSLDSGAALARFQSADKLN